MLGILGRRCEHLFHQHVQCKVMTVSSVVSAVSVRSNTIPAARYPVQGGTEVQE